jgi:hypothetical protein
MTSKPRRLRPSARDRSAQRARLKFTQTRTQTPISRSRGHRRSSTGARHKQALQLGRDEFGNPQITCKSQGLTSPSGARITTEPGAVPPALVLDEVAALRPSYPQTPVRETEPLQSTGARPSACSRRGALGCQTIVVPDAYCDSPAMVVRASGQTRVTSSCGRGRKACSVM